ncbi:MAG TPA: hypothetical protein VLM85_22030 [Polyangiaceae bacterium]|nr:hypothetical protein [Polyangiaceae bacterium]
MKRSLPDPILGDLTRLDEMRSGGVKGNLMTSRIWYVRDRFGEKELQRIAAAVPAARAIVEKPPLPFVWCSFGDMIDVDRAILEGPMGGDLEKMREFGGAIAKHDLPTLYKVLFKVGTPRFLMKRVGIVAATYIRDSPMKGEDMSDGGVRVVQTGKTFPYYFCGFGVCGWFEAAIELSGGKNIRVVHSACRHRGAENCAWDNHWD